MYKKAELKTLLAAKAKAIREEEVLRNGKDSDIDSAAVQRIITREEALSAWRELSRKLLLKENYSFSEVVEQIISQAANPYWDASIMKTPGQTRKVALQAAQFAKQLAGLINANAWLETVGLRSMETVEVSAARRRLENAVLEIPREPWLDENGKVHWFPNKLEKKLDLLQATSDKSVMTTEEALSIVRNYSTFADALKRFAAQVIETPWVGAPIKQPNRSRAHEQAFATELCQTVNYYYGAPHYAVVAALTSAVFEVGVDDETVKKWWQRSKVRGDKSS